MYLLFAGLFASPSRHKKQYRNDYVYNAKSDAFYKLHIQWDWNNKAKITCQIEGAELMVPKADDIRQLHGMLKEFPDIGDHVWVANDGLAHESAEEQPIINCYRYYESVSSCYKISQAAYSWNQAYAECRAEGSHLVILNSEAERQLIYNITNAAPPVEGATATWFFFAGFRAHKTSDNVPRVFKTVFNQTLEDAGFVQWSPGEHNNALSNEYCGTIFKNDGRFNDIDCAHTYPFICEKEVTNKRVEA